ncbi:MAG: hypothetical protein QNJ97_15525 [Myxococcota bacterium]|nr:hypothetical protein [Myxococcota bacterium]
MSTSPDGKKDVAANDIVRLKIHGAQMAVNTLREQQTRRGVSLICPFPALEMNIPVHYGPKDGASQCGTIHRISVEDDPETSLPRLRLSIRTDDGRSTVIAEPPENLIAASTKSMDEDADPDRAIVDEFFSFETKLIDDDDWAEDDPEWVNCQDVSMPDQSIARAKTRRRYKMVRAMGWAVVVVALGVAGFALHRSGVFGIDEIRSYVAGFSLGDIPTSQDSPKARQTDNAAHHPMLESRDPALIATPTSPAEAHTPDVPETIAATPAAAAGAQEAAQSPAPSVALVSAAAPASDVAENTPLKSDPPGAPAQASDTPKDEVTLLLPTRWPVEYASGYRVRDPNGVVIDVPGGLARREGWIESLAHHPLIRSVKSIQRETGVRFIVYVNGNLPRFMTSPRANGVALRLYYPKDDALQTEQVASID